MQYVGKVLTNAHLTTEITEAERRHAEVARMAAGEAIVLLENNGVLPLDAAKPIAVYGDGAGATVKGGSGSGEVNERHSVTILEGLKAAGFSIANEKMNKEYAAYAIRRKQEYTDSMIKKAGLLNFGVTMAYLSEPNKNPPFPVLTDEDMAKDVDTCVFVVARISGESYDRKLEKGDYYLSDEEAANIRMCAKYHKNVVLILNAGGVVDCSAVSDVPIAAKLFIGMLGTVGGTAVADVLSGKVTPSGKLSDTWAVKYEDIPNGMEYSYLNGNKDYDDYKEGIYVGYRYFDSFGVKPLYPFGYGLSYTTFDISCQNINLEDSLVQVDTVVSNTGNYSGKEVVQLYVSCPGGKLAKEYQTLATFEKTAILEAGSRTKLTLSFDMKQIASYDASNGCYILEKGDYILRLGNSSRDTQVVGCITLEQDMIVSKHDHVCVPSKPIPEITAPRVTHTCPAEVPHLVLAADAIHIKVYTYDEVAPYSDPAVDQIMDSLKLSELVDFCSGNGTMDMLIANKHYFTMPGATGYTTNKYFDRGIPDICFCDGPAGFRAAQVAVAVKGKNIVKNVSSPLETLSYLPKLVKMFGFGTEKDGTPLYQYATAFPVGISLAQTWNKELVEQVGIAAGEEVHEYGVSYWLAPGLNIHRNPLCGRNYEYYSEDPYLSGQMAAAMTRGVQKNPETSVSLKHFCCNNQETNRGNTSANINERALREIYLRSFEIAVKEGHAMGLMTSYNRINGEFAAVSHDLLTKILRNEWDFDGVIMTDWDSKKPDCEADKSMHAGLNILMAGDAAQKKEIMAGLKAGRITEKDIRRNASRVLRTIVGSEQYRFMHKEKK